MRSRSLIGILLLACAMLTFPHASIAASSASEMTSPSAGSVLSGSSVMLEWSAGSGVVERFLTVGSSAGASDIYAGYQGNALSRNVIGIPANGGTVYVRLMSFIGGMWSVRDYTYTAALPMSIIIWPPDRVTLTGAVITFQFQLGQGVTEQYLTVGSSPGAADIYAGYQGTALTRQLDNVPTDGRSIHVTLSSLVGGTWLPVSYMYTAAPSAPAAASVIISPRPRSTLPGSTVTITWSAGSGVVERWLAVGSTPNGGSDIYGGYQGAALSRTVSGIPTDGREIFATLSSWVDGAWRPGAVVFEAADSAERASIIISPQGYDALGTTPTFQWTAGIDVTDRYLMVGTSMGGSEIYAGYQGAALSKTVQGVPTAYMGIYVRLMSYVGGTWLVKDYFFASSSVLPTPIL